MRSAFLISLMAAAAALLVTAERLLWVFITGDGDADAGCFLAVCIAVLVVLAVGCVVTVGVGVMAR